MILKDIINKFDKSNIKAGDGIAEGSYPLYTCSPIVNKYLNNYMCDGEAIILSTGGNFFAHYVNGKFNYSTDCYVFNTDKYNLKYLYYYLLSKSEDINKMFRGAGLKHLNKNEFVLLNVKELGFKEQENIVNQLEKISELIKIRKQEIDKCNNLIKSQFAEMFDDINDYEKVSFYISSLDAGKSLAGECECQNKVLKTGSVSYNYFDPNEVKNLPTNYKPLKAHEVKKGDVIISRMNTAELVGACGYVWNEVRNLYYPDRLWRANLKNNCNAIYIWQSLIQDKFKLQIREICSGTSGSMKNISKVNFLNLKIKKVPIDLQNRFAMIVEQIDKQKFEFEKSLKKLEELQSSLMQEYFG